MLETPEDVASHNSGNASHQGALRNSLGLFFHQLILSSANKAEIFSEALSELRSGHRQASVILENLQKWNPEAASRFTLRSTSTVLSTPFRLIYPNYDLPSFQETGPYARQFIAVSYCWRSSSFLPDEYGNHDVWPFKASIVDAILAEKPHPRVGIWVDQMCIEQSSMSDKQASVAAMDIIYRSCLRLIIILEDVLLNEQEIQLVRKYDISARTYNDGWKFAPDEIDTFAKFYEKVDGARWWSRAWCFHEFCVHQPWSDKRQSDALFQVTFILCGPNDTTVKIRWVNLQLLMGGAMCALPHAPIWWKGQATVSGMIESTDRATGWMGSIMARHNVVRVMGSSFLEDRLSVMMNLCCLSLAYRGPALGTEEELLYMGSLLALAAGDSNPLSMMDKQSTTLNRKSTWLSKHEVNDTTLPKLKVQRMKGIHRVDESAIEMDMVFLDAPWRSVKANDLRSTYEIFPDTIKTTDPASQKPEAKGRVTSIYSYSDTELDLPRRRFLASCILNGHIFTGRLWEQIKRDVVGPNYNVGYNKDLSANPALYTAAKTLLAQLVPVSTLLTIAQPSASVLEDIALFLTWLTDPRSMYYIGRHTFRVPCTMQGDSTLITSLTGNEYFKEGPDRELSVAVPVDLLEMSCIPLRVWILRPALGDNGDNKWRIVGKGMLLGEPDLLEEAEQSAGQTQARVALRERVIVGG